MGLLDSFLPQSSPLNDTSQPEQMAVVATPTTLETDAINKPYNGTSKSMDYLHSTPSHPPHFPLPSGKGRIQNTKLTSGSFIPKEAWTRLNLPSGSGTSSSSMTIPTQPPAQPSSDSPHIFQNDHQYFSEDSMSSQSQLQSQLQSEPHSNPICLIPKHQLKRMHSNPITPTLEPVTTNTNPNAGKDHADLTNLLHDDIDVTDSPEQHVDYLTHKWKEDEISKSWKYVTLRRSAVADSARLENASWRTWAQTRLGLKTISPEELNWSKDSDVTWLYGPVIKSTTSNATLNDDSCAQGMNRNASDEQRMTGGTDSIMTDVTANANIIGTGGTSVSTSTGTVTAIATGTGTGTTDTVMTDGDNDHFLDNKHTNTHNSNVTVGANDNDHQANENDQSLLNNTHHTEHTEHLKSILKKKSNVEKMISDASYSRLQHLLENRENKLRGADSSVTPSASPSPMIEPTVPGEVTDLGTGSGTGKESSSTTFFNHRVDVPSPLISHVNSPLLSATSPAFSVSTSPASGSPTSAHFSTQHQQQHQHQHQHQRPILPSRIKSSLKTSLFGTHTSLSPSLKPVEKKKQIHFNMRVDQCVAVIQDEYTSDANTNTDVDLSPSAGEEDEREEDADKDDEKSLGKRTLQNMHFSLESSDSDSDWNSDSDSNTNTNSNTINVNDNTNLNNEDVELTDLHKQQHQMRGPRRRNRGSRRRRRRGRTIAPLPATTLKFGSDDEFEREQELERERERERQNASQGGIMSGVSFGTPGKMYTVSHNTKTNRGYDYYYDYNTVYSNNSNPLIYSTVSNSQNKAKPVVADVQMFDVPANCQLDSVIDSNPVPSDANVCAGPNTNTGASIVDVPASFLHDIPQDFVGYEPSGQENDGDGDTAMSEHIEKAVESSDSDTGSDSTSGYENYENYSDNSTPVNGGFTDLRRTTSIGSRNSSTQSLASIKVGLSGLDLTTTGLRRSDSNSSSGAGSRPQLYQLHQTTSLNRPISGIGSNGGQSQGQGQSQGRKFMFDDSSSDSESDEYSGDGMDVDDDILAQAPVVPLSVRNGLVNVVRSGTSLADINQQFGTLSNANSNANSTTSINAKGPTVGGKKSAFNLMDDSESGSESESD
jgi:hypothetical protein